MSHVKHINVKELEYDDDLEETFIFRSSYLDKPISNVVAGKNLNYTIFLFFCVKTMTLCKSTIFKLCLN